MKLQKNGKINLLVIIGLLGLMVPLTLNTNLQTCWYVAKSHDRNVITLEDVHEAFCHLQIDGLGLENVDRAYLKILLECGQSTLGVISSKLSLPALTIQRVVEPYLLKEVFIIKDKSAIRIITAKGRKHIESTSVHKTMEVKV